MIINNFEERVKNLESNNTFYLCEGFKNKNTIIINEVLPLENGRQDITIDRENLYLTDNKGNVLAYKNNPYYDINILHVNDNNILIGTSEINWIRKDIIKKDASLNLFKLIDDQNKLFLINNLYDRYEEKTDLKVTNIDDDNGIILIEKANDKEKKAFLYSINEDRNLTPVFSELELIDEENKMFSFKDKIVSNAAIDDKQLDTEIIGFINIDGKFYEKVYDKNYSYVYDIDLNTHPNFMQYKALKRHIARKLDDELDNLLRDKKVKLKVK